MLHEHVPATCLTYTGKEIGVQRQARGTGTRVGADGVLAAVGADGAFSTLVNVCQRAKLEVRRSEARRRDICLCYLLRVLEQPRDTCFLITLLFSVSCVFCCNCRCCC